MTGNTVYETQFVHKGITYKAQIQNVNRTWNFPITAAGMGAGFGGSYGVSKYNPAGNTEVIRIRYPDGSPNSTDDVTYDILFTAERNGNSYPVKIAVLDAQVTNYSTNTNQWNEDLEFTTSGTNFTFMEEIGGNPSSTGAIVGENTQQITYNNTIPGTSTVPPRNAMFHTRGTNLRITTRSGIIYYGTGPATQAAAYAVVLNCDTDNDGTPNYLDTDSDNDNCYDAIEGGGNVTSNDLNSDGTISGPVSSDGVPNLVGTGQTVGNSLLATQMGVDTPLSDQTYQVGDSINFNITDAFFQSTLLFNAGVPDYSSSAKQNTGINYQWQVSTDNGTSFNNLAGETNPNLSLTGTAAMNGNIYRAMADCLDRECLTELSRARITKNNTAPVVSSSNITVDEESTGTHLGLAAPTDADGDSLTITVTGLPTLGTVTKANGDAVNTGDTLTSAELTGLIYDAPDEYNGTDPVGDFTYSVNDGTVTVNGSTDITVNPVNDAPNLQNDSNTTIANVAVSGTILTAADTDAENNNLSAIATPVNGPSHGSITINTNGSYTYTPNSNYVGNDQVEIRVCDDGTPVSACANQLLTITITSNDPPVINAHDDTTHLGTNYNLLDLVDSATDTEDGVITGSVTVSNNGGFNKDVPGTYTITFSVTDSDSNTTNETAQITVDSGDSPIITTHNDIIMEGDSFDLLDLIDSITDTEDGNIAINNTNVTTNDGGFDENVPGTYTITFSVTDSHGNTTTETATIEVQYANVFDPPSARKTVTDSAPEMEWKMIWINDGNAAALNTQVLDDIPTGTTYVNGSLTCDARGASTTAVCTYDQAENRVRWEGDIAPDVGGTNEEDSLNEVVIIFKTTVPDEINTVENQAEAYYDQNGDGDFNNDKTAGQSPALTQNGDGNSQATVWSRTLSGSDILLPNTGVAKTSLKYLALLGLIPLRFVLRKKQ